MKLEDHESTIRNKMLQHREVINTDDVWSALEPQLHPKKKRRYMLLFFLCGIAILLVSGGLWVVQNQHSQASVSPSNNEIKSVAAENSNYKPLYEIQKEKPKEKKAVVINENIDSKSVINSNVEFNSVNANNKSHEVESIKSIKVSTTSQSIANDINDNRRTASQISLDVAEMAKSIADTDIKQSIQNDDILNSKKEDGTNTSFLNERKQNTSDAQINDLSIQELNGKNHKIISKIASHEPEEIQFHVKMPPLALLKKKTKANRWTISAHSGWGDFSSKYKATVENDEYTTLLNTSNNGISTQQAGLGLSYSIRNWRLTSGIQYSRIVNRLSLHNMTRIDTTVNGVQSIYYRQSGVVETEEGDVVAILIIDQNVQWHTYRHLLDIPLMLGYEQRFGRFSIGGDAGIMVNVSQRSNGAFLGEDGRLVKFNQQENINPYRKTNGVSQVYQVRLGYDMSPNIRIELNGQLRKFPSQLIQFDQPVQENITAQNVGLKLLYKL